ncbi:hypothetical protein LINPERPRIM_LOCUS5173, partial [Linum perenne]
EWTHCSSLYILRIYYLGGAKLSSCLVCSKWCKGKNLVQLKKCGIGFAGHDENLVATDFKYLGSGTEFGICNVFFQNLKLYSHR